MLTYNGEFRVCYRPRISVVSWQQPVQDAHAIVPWDYQGNAEGFPYGVKTRTHTVKLRWRGKAAVCITNLGCGPTKWPWVDIYFTDDNTLYKVWGLD
jgi:hypothetical protein